MTTTATMLSELFVDASKRWPNIESVAVRWTSEQQPDLNWMMNETNEITLRRDTPLEGKPRISGWIGPLGGMSIWPSIKRAVMLRWDFLRRSLTIDSEVENDFHQAGARLKCLFKEAILAAHKTTNPPPPDWTHFKLWAQWLHEARGNWDAHDDYEVSRIGDVFLASAKLLASPTPDQIDPFVPDPDQKRILQALEGRALKKQALADECFDGDGSRLYGRKGKPGLLNELVALGKVAWKSKLGFYRPDAPPK